MHAHTHTHTDNLTSGVRQSSNIHRHSLSLFPLNPAKIYQPNVTTSENLYAICIIPAAAVKFRAKQIAQGGGKSGGAQWHLPVADACRIRIPIASVFIWVLRISELCAWDSLDCHRVEFPPPPLLTTHDTCKRIDSSTRTRSHTHTHTSNRIRFCSLDVRLLAASGLSNALSLPFS